MQDFFLDIVAKTDTGNRRPNNEDAITFKKMKSGQAFVIVADGMGGHRAGEVASQLACKALHIQLQKITWNKAQLIATIEEVNRSVYKTAQSHIEYQGMGTTIVLACINQDQLIVAHVGDSRCYQFEDGKLKALTRDHSLIEKMLEQGLIEKEDLGKSMRKNILTRALGVSSKIEITVSQFQLKKRGMLLLCSDGLTDMLDDIQIQQLLSSAESLKIMAQNLINAANEAGGRDNISVVLFSY